MGWLFANWRLKLLALVLTLALLGAVAFSQNPPEVTSVPVKVAYQPDPASKGLVLTEFKKTVDVPVLGLADAIAQYRSSAAGVVVDLSGARPGRDQVYYARPIAQATGVTFPTTSIPVTLTIERLRTQTLDIEVRTPNKLPGIEVRSAEAICGNGAMPCQVTVTGPASLLEGLKAYINYDAQISQAQTFSSPSQRILFEKNGRPLDLSKLDYDPAPSWTPSVATVRIEVQGGTATKTVAITYTLTGTQACGYTISSVSFSPGQTVNVSGPVEAVAKVQSVSIDPISIAGLNQNLTVTRSVNLPDPSLQATPSQVRVVVVVSRAFSCAAPSPSPT